MRNIQTCRWAAAVLVLLGVAGAAPAQTQPPTTRKFTFAPAPASANFTQVKPTDTYANETGYGFEPGAAVTQNPAGISSDKPFYFSTKLPEGNYNVTVTLGDPTASSDTTVKAELRRLMLWNIHTDANQTAKRTFTVNIRTPNYPGGHVHLKGKRESEEERWAWDDQLELEFNGIHPSVQSIEITKVDCPTVFLIGDSTVCDQPTEPWNSWGQMLTVLFKPNIAIANHAESGETLRGSLTAHRLDKIVSLLKPGDYLLIQFGHNDMKEHGPGDGAFLNYTDELKQFVAAARGKSATPVLITSMNRNRFDADGHVINTFGDYPEAVRRVAAAEKVPLIDLNAMSKTLYEAIGQKNINELFAYANGKHDGTHHDAYGSYELAKCVVLGIQQDNLKPLTNFIVDNFHFDPAKPDPIADFHYPPSPAANGTKPPGN